MALAKALSQYWLRIQSSLFPWLEEELGEMTEKEQKLVATLELIRIERFTVYSRSLRGRPPKERAAVARAFVAKAVYNMPTTRALLDRLVSLSGAQDAVMLVGSARFTDGSPAVFRTLLVLTKDSTYKVEVVADVAKWKSLSPVFDEIFNSFTIEFPQ